MKLVEGLFITHILWMAAKFEEIIQKIMKLNEVQSPIFVLVVALKHLINIIF